MSALGNFEDLSIALRNRRVRGVTAGARPVASKHSALHFPGSAGVALLAAAAALMLVAAQALAGPASEMSRENPVGNSLRAERKVSADGAALEPGSQNSVTRASGERVLQRIRSEGPVRVLVRVASTHSPEGDLIPRKRAAQRARIANNQEILARTLTRGRSRVLAQFESIPYMAMEVDEEGLLALQTSEQVVAIEEDIELDLQLDSSVPIVGAPTAWAAGATGAGVAVAVLDTGVDKAHPFFRNGKVVSEACYSSGEVSFCPSGATSATGSGSGTACPSNYGGCAHGTHVAGIAAGYDGRGPHFGVAKDAQIISIKIASGSHSSPCGWRSPPCATIWNSDILRGLERVLALRSTHNIAAVNLSLGGGSFRSTCDAHSPALKALVDNLRSYGIATIAVSGNDGDRTAMQFPACISSAISVGAVNDDGSVASFSNTSSFLSLLAPGVGVVSAVPGNSVASGSGTSMAAPHVAGAWALYRQKYPSASVSAVRDALRSAADVVGDGINPGLRRLNLARVPFPPAAPSNLVASASSSNQINLNWMDNSSNEAGFRIQRKTGAAGTWALIATVGAGVRSYADANLSASTTYFYRVRAYNSAGSSTFTNEASATTFGVTSPPPSGIPAPPSNLTASAVSASRIDLTWNDNSSNETGFRVQRKTGAAGTWALIATVGAGVRSYADGNLTTSTTYFYRVRAYNTAGGSTFTNEASATTGTSPAVPAAPGPLGVKPVGTTQIDLAWSDNSNNETGFRIERKVTASGTYQVIANVGANVRQYSDTGLIPATVYYYRLRAFNSSGFSAYSPESATVTAIEQCKYSVSHATRTFGATGGSDTIQVTAGAGCQHVSSSRSDWITITGGTSGNGAAAVTYSVAPNTSGSSRTGTMVVAGWLFTVTQSAQGCASPVRLSLSASRAGALDTADCSSTFRGSSYYADRYTFEGIAGQQVVLSLRSSSFDPYLYLNTPSGLLLANDDGGQGWDSRLPAGSGAYTLPTSGTYTIEVTSFGQRSTGSYTLDVTRL